MQIREFKEEVVLKTEEALEKTIKKVELVKQIVSTNTHKETSSYNTLSSLSTFSHNIKILVKVITKSELKKFNGKFGEGTIFNFCVIDKAGTEMEFACFNMQAKLYYNLIQEDKVYEIVNPLVKIGHNKFKNSNYRLMANDLTLIREKKDDGFNNEVKINLIKLSDLEEIPIKSTIDVLGYVIETKEREIRKLQKEDVAMKVFTIADETGFRIDVVLWRKLSEIEPKVGDIILLKSISINDYRGRNLNSCLGTKIAINPTDFQEAEPLKKWMSKFKGIFQSYKHAIKRNNSEKDVIFKNKVFYIEDVIRSIVLDHNQEGTTSISTIKCTVIMSTNGERNYYTGCPVKNCKKKLIEDENGLYCIKCCQTIKSPAYYLSISTKVKDANSEYWIDMFGPVAESFLNCTAEEYKKIFDDGNVDKLSDLIKRIEYKQYYMTIKFKQSLYDNMIKKKISATRTEPVNTSLDNEFNRIYNKLQIII